MAKARALDKRRKAIRNIRKITRTMELIATARFKKAMDRATAATAYTKRITEVVADLAGAAFGSAGERCMALPVVVPVGEKTADALRDKLVRRSTRKHKPWTAVEAVETASLQTLIEGKSRSAASSVHRRHQTPSRR